jgi:hypothetical protein
VRAQHHGTDLFPSSPGAARRVPAVPMSVLVLDRGAKVQEVQQQHQFDAPGAC